MQITYNIEPLILKGTDREAARQYLTDVPYFDADVMKYHDQALQTWRSVAGRIAQKERELKLPFTLAETPKLYALDALCIASPFAKDSQQLVAIAELFTVFYLMTHFFDDHVEHPDKFLSKFDFSSEASLQTQHGAAPFSFLLISFAVVSEILGSALQLSDRARIMVVEAMYDRLALQTREFTAERQVHPGLDVVLEMKARQVNGRALGVLADLLRAFLDLSQPTFERLEMGLMYLGSMEQFTDDIRDLSIDTALRNANLIVSASELGREAGAKKIAEMYATEVEYAKKYLEPFYEPAVLSSIFSLPFYPFMVNKQELEQSGKNNS